MLHPGDLTRANHKKSFFKKSLATVRQCAKVLPSNGTRNQEAPTRELYRGADYPPRWQYLNARSSRACSLSLLIQGRSRAKERQTEQRKESRGGHFREDFPNKSEAFGNLNICIKKDSSGQMQSQHLPKVKMRDDLQQIIEEMK